MKNVTKVLLTVIAMFGFSLNVFANASGDLFPDRVKYAQAKKLCTGYSEEIHAERVPDGKVTLLDIQGIARISPWGICVFSKYDPTMKWKGINGNYYNVPDGFKAVKSHAQKASEKWGLYNLIKDYGLEGGLTKIKKLFAIIQGDAFDDFDYHMRNTPMNLIIEKAEKYPLADVVKRMMQKHNILASL
jgi:hypothetical protein